MAMSSPQVDMPGKQWGLEFDSGFEESRIAAAAWSLVVIVLNFQYHVFTYLRTFLSGALVLLAYFRHSHLSRWDLFFGNVGVIHWLIDVNDEVENYSVTKEDTVSYLLLRCGWSCLKFWPSSLGLKFCVLVVRSPG